MLTLSKYCVSTCNKGESGLENDSFCLLFLLYYIYDYIGGRGKDIWKCAYVIYEWPLSYKSPHVPAELCSRLSKRNKVIAPSGKSKWVRKTFFIFHTFAFLQQYFFNFFVIVAIWMINESDISWKRWWIIGILIQRGIHLYCVSELSSW